MSSERTQSAQEACRRSWPHPNAACAAHGPSTPAPCSRPASPIAASRGLQRASGSTMPAAFPRATQLRVSMLIVLILPCAIGPLAATANLILGWRLKLGRFFCDHLLLLGAAAAAQPPEAAHPRGRPELFLLRPRPLQTASPNRKQKPLSSPTVEFGKKIYLEAPPKQAMVRQSEGARREPEQHGIVAQARCRDRKVGRAGAAVRGRRF